MYDSVIVPSPTHGTDYRDNSGSRTETSTPWRLTTLSCHIPITRMAMVAATAVNVTSQNAVRHLVRSAATADAVGILPSAADSQTVANGVCRAVHRNRQLTVLPALSTRLKTASRHSTLLSYWQLAVCHRNVLFRDIVVSAKLDTGADCCMMLLKTYNTIPSFVRQSSKSTADRRHSWHLVRWMFSISHLSL